MYFGAFAAFMMENCIYSGSAVGINPLGADWTNLANYLGGGKGYCVAGDFSSFDSTQCSAITIALLDIINDWYDDGNDDIRYQLWVELFNSRHLHGNKIFQFNHCLPSGHPLTSIVNSMYVNIAFRKAWIGCDNSNGVNIELFDDCVKLVAYGDDNICLISDEGVEFGYDFYTIRDGMAKIGLTYTPENKLETNPPPYKNLTDCTFLKRGFMLEDNRWLAPLDLDTVLEMPMWYRHGANPIQRQRDNIDNALCELSMHDEETFDIYGCALMQCIHENRGVLRMPSRLLDQDFYRIKCYSNWLDEESLAIPEVSSLDSSNVPYPSSDDSQADTTDAHGLRLCLN
jgi:hypothetical protein